MGGGLPDFSGRPGGDRGRQFAQPGLELLEELPVDLDIAGPLDLDLEDAAFNEGIEAVKKAVNKFYDSAAKVGLDVTKLEFNVVAEGVKK